MGPLRCRWSLFRVLTSRHFPRVLPIAPPIPDSFYCSRRKFHSSPVPRAIKPQILKDVGEGITEIQIIQWYVQEGAHIEEWKPLCQYQSDKAVDDITSRYEGVIKKLHFQPDDTVPTGKALCDIEVDDAKYPDDNALSAAQEATPTKTSPVRPDEITQRVAMDAAEPQPEIIEEKLAEPGSRGAALATPAVRGLLKELKVDILEVAGTGKGGRVMKEDVYRHVAERDSEVAMRPSVSTSSLPPTDPPQTETITPLTPIQSQMFRTMTRSLSIPHFLYAEELNIGTLSSLRQKLAAHPTQPQKLSYLPFIIKALSLSMSYYPLLNARVDATTNPVKPTLIMRSNHNIGVAMDTPTGLLVPNIKNVRFLSILDIAAELNRLSSLARSGKLTSTDLNGGTITVSNIGSIGGTYVAPVIVPSEVAILGIGKAKTVPVFDEVGNVVKGELMSFSWSADHRVVDGATMARVAGKVKEYLEAPEKMMLAMR